MLTRYRVIKRKDNLTGAWRPIGAVYERAFGSGEVHALPLIGPGDQKTDWRDWRAIDERLGEYGIFGPPLEEYDKAFVDHADRYHLSSEIRTIEGDSYKEIRERLYQRYVLAPMRAKEEAQPERERLAISYEISMDRPLTVVRESQDKEGNEQ